MTSTIVVLTHVTNAGVIKLYSAELDQKIMKAKVIGRIRVIQYELKNIIGGNLGIGHAED